MGICKKESPATLGRMFKLTLKGNRAALSVGGRTLGFFEGEDEIEEISRDLLDTHHDFILKSEFELIIRGYPDGTCSYRELDEN